MEMKMNFQIEMKRGDGNEKKTPNEIGNEN